MAKKKLSIQPSPQPPAAEPSFSEQAAHAAREIWWAGLGALDLAEREGTRLYETLVDRGLAWERERGEAFRSLHRAGVQDGRPETGDAPADAPASAPAAERLQQAVHARVEDALARANLPSGAELRSLVDQVQVLTERIEALSSAVDRRRRR